MATTTNYAWETPDDTDLVKDGAAAIRTLGSSIDTTTKALNPSTTLGDIEYRSSTANTNTRLGIGTTGQILTVAGGVPTWAAPAGGGKVLQVVQGTSTTQTSTTSNSFVDSGLSVTITPAFTTSKILVFAVGVIETSSGNNAGIRLIRGATSIFEWSYYDAHGSYVGAFGQSMNYLDSPSTTSATTYKVQIQALGGTTRWSAGSTISTLIAMEIGA